MLSASRDTGNSFRGILYGLKEDEDVVDQHNKSVYFSDIVDFDIPSKYIF